MHVSPQVFLYHKSRRDIFWLFMASLNVHFLILSASAFRYYPSASILQPQFSVLPDVISYQLLHQNSGNPYFENLRQKDKGTERRTERQGQIKSKNEFSVVVKIISQTSFLSNRQKSTFPSKWPGIAPKRF